MKPEQRHATPVVYGYLVILSLLFMTPGNLATTPIQFIYQKDLHLQADQTAILKLIINAPGYVAFLFGICRDRFNPLNMGDRGFIFIFSALSGIVYIALATVPLTIVTLAIGLMVAGVTLGLVGAAFQALIRNISQARMMSGRMSTAYNLLAYGIPTIALFAYGQIANLLTWRQILELVGVIYFALAAVAFWKPNSIFEGIPSGGTRTFAKMRADIRMLMRLRGYWVAIAIWSVWAFSPAGPTPLMYFLTQKLHMTPGQFGNFNAIFSGAFIPTILLFGALCKRMSLRKLLFISTAIGIPQWLPVMFIHTIPQAFVIAAIMGLAGGLANTAYFGLLFRACPEELAGTGMLVASSLALIVVEVGNVLGGKIYVSWGFTGCALITVLVYTLLWPLCRMLPNSLIDPPDDQPVPTAAELVA